MPDEHAPRARLAPDHVDQWFPETPLHRVSRPRPVMRCPWGVADDECRSRLALPSILTTTLPGRRVHRDRARPRPLPSETC